jgi:hypothetical protein
MSRENVEIIRRVTEAWNRADLGEILEVVDPDGEAVPVIPTLVDGDETVYRGISGMRASVRALSGCCCARGPGAPAAAVVTPRPNPLRATRLRRYGHSPFVRS